MTDITGKRKERIEALVFDMDGLIFDSEKVVQRSWEDAGNRLGIPHLGSHIYNTLGFNVKKREEYFRKAVKPDFPMEKFNELTRARFREIVEQEGLGIKPGVRELLTYARQNGYKTALATSSRRAHAVRNLKEAGLYDLFDGSVCGDMVKKGKPDPEIYLTACEIIGADPKNSIALEDAPSGIRAAYAAGMYPVMVPDLAKPDEETLKLVYKICETLYEVKEILEQGKL